jgi:GNAT superfamily N-acetyltransferase
MDETPEWANGARLKRLTADTTIKPFSCGVSELDQFLAKDVYRHSKFLGLVTYLLENDNETLAFYSLENDRLTVCGVDDFWEENTDVDFREMYLDCNSFPAVKIAHLAVNENYHRRKIGKYLIEYIIGSFLNNTNKTGCQFLLVDALETPNSKFFYNKMGFQYATVRDVNKSSRLRYLCLLGFSNDIK